MELFKFIFFPRNLDHEQEFAYIVAVGLQARIQDFEMGGELL